MYRKCEICGGPVSRVKGIWTCSPCGESGAGLDRAIPRHRGERIKAVYISGPITGIDNGNREAFRAAAIFLQNRGFEAVNPHVVNAGREPDDWLGYMRRDVKALTDCHAIYMLRGWWFSRGAKVEYRLARGLSLRVIHQSGWWGGLAR